MGCLLRAPSAGSGRARTGDSRPAKPLETETRNRPCLYNTGVSDKTSRTRAALRAETIGLLVVALVILAILLLRSGGGIDWYAR